MNLQLKIDKELERYVSERRKLDNTIGDGIQYIFHFANDYGASIVKHKYSYGSSLDYWELAVVEWYGDREWYLTYDTEVTDDVIGYLDDEDVNKLLYIIKNLDSRWEREHDEEASNHQRGTMAEEIRSGSSI